MRLPLFLRILIASLVMAILTSCGSSDEPQDVVAPEHQIVFLFSPGGLGDMGYNDCILTGLQRFKLAHPQEDIFMYSPQSLDEAEGIFSDWLNRPGSDIHTMFVLASSDYEALAEEYLGRVTLSDNKQVLLFESDKDFGARTSTFQISMYGASYLAGRMAANAVADGNALIVLANRSDRPISVAKDGFIDGFGSECVIEYLAEDWTGYISSALAYQKMEDWSKDYGFIFPVAGGSNSGIYRYSREFADGPLLAGVDVDQSHLSHRISGSVIKRIDNLTYEYLCEWIETHTLPETGMYGLESGYVDWELAQSFVGEFGPTVASYRDEAKTAEQKYLDKK